MRAGGNKNITRFKLFLECGKCGGKTFTDNAYCDKEDPSIEELSAANKIKCPMCNDALLNITGVNYWKLDRNGNRIVPNTGAIFEVLLFLLILLFLLLFLLCRPFL